MSDLVDGLKARALDRRRRDVRNVGEANVGPLQGFFDWQVAVEIVRLRKELASVTAALEGVVNNIEDYERVNNLSPSPGRTECWDSVTRAKAVLAKAKQPMQRGIWGMSVSKEMLELAERCEHVASHSTCEDPRGLLRTVAAALRASAVAEPVAWRHEITEPEQGTSIMFSRSNDNPWSHWVESHRAKCTYRAAPLYEATHPAPAAPVTASVREALNDIVAAVAANQGGTQGAIRKRALEALASLPAPEAAPTREEIISIVEEECFLNHFSPVEKTKSQKTLWRVGHNIRERILALKAAPAK